MRLAAVLVVALCASCVSGPTVTLDRYRGVLRTHFDGIPDGSAVCAVLRNGSEQRVEWVGLRLRAYPTHGEKPGRWTSKWLYEGHLEPGQSQAIEFVEPPIADEVELEVRGAGSGPSELVGRKVRKVRECSEASLQRRLSADVEGRTAPGVALYSIVRRNDRSAEVVVASDR
jgi:hypothetical protein